MGLRGGVNEALDVRHCLGDKSRTTISFGFGARAFKGLTSA